MIAAPVPVPALIAPAEVAPDVQTVRKKRKRSGDGRQTQTMPNGTALFIGAVILLDSGDGQALPCQIVALEPEPLCVPVSPPNN